MRDKYRKLDVGNGNKDVYQYIQKTQYSTTIWENSGKEKEE